ncbi:unnamed protein product [Paramecium octaurelia]|uniref:Uncharacterized protein n=1 Tax=Paramecium octaurelia TaxID=43137 RepID=A0A8S1TBS9_PAROT|nr:unnamed protein product [Paramecium octaurelia]
MRQTEQQANALNREFKTSLHKIKQELKEQLPEEITQNPHLQLQLKDYRKTNSNQQANTIYGSDTLVSLFQERSRLKESKMQKVRLNDFTRKL